MDQEASQDLHDISEDSPSKVMLKEARKSTSEMEQKIFDVLHHLSALHERIEVLHERDVDYDTRLHNSYFDIAKACSERELLKNQIQRDATRQAGKEKRYEELVVRLRKERDALKDLCKHLQAEKAREQVKGDEVAQMWVQEAREGKMALRPVRDDDQQRANGTKRKRDADDAGGKEVPAEEVSKTVTPQVFGPLFDTENGNGGQGMILAEQSFSIRT